MPTLNQIFYGPKASPVARVLNALPKAPAEVKAPKKKATKKKDANDGSTE